MANPLATKIAAAGAAALLTAGGLAFAAYQHPTAGAIAQAAAVTTTSGTAAAAAGPAGALRQPALKTVLDQLVGQGKISQTQEGEIVSSLQQYQQAHHQARPGKAQGVHGFLAGEMQAAATALKLTPAQVRQQLQSGKSIDDIAAAQKVSTDSVQQAVLAQAKTRLDTVVKNGKITQQREDQALAALKARLPQVFAARPGQFSGRQGQTAPTPRS